MATPSVKRWASGSPKKGGPLVKRWAEDAREKIFNRVHERAFKSDSSSTYKSAGERAKANDASYSADYKTSRLRQSYYGSEAQLREDHAEAAKLHQKAAEHYVKEAAGHLSQDNGTHIAFAQSKIAHETGTAEDHALAAKYHADRAQHLRESAASYREQAGRSQNPGQLNEVADRWEEKAKDHEERAADHQGLAGGSQKWEHEGASEKPLPEVYAKDHWGSADMGELKANIEKEGQRHLDAAKGLMDKAARHQELRDRHAHEAKSASPRTASGWDEEKHPRDDQGRFA